MAGLAGPMLTQAPVLRLPVRGKDQQATTGRSVTERDCSKRSRALEPPFSADAILSAKAS